MTGKGKTAPLRAVFCLFGVSVQHSILTRRHLPDDGRCRRSFYDPSSERLGFFGFQAESQCRNHFEAVSFNDVSVSAAGAANNMLFIQNSAFAYRSDIRAYGGSEYSEQVGDLALRKPNTIRGGTDSYPSALDSYGVSCHNRLVL